MTNAPSQNPMTPSAQPRVLASPLARRLAQDHQLDLAAIDGTGPNGRVIKRDILPIIEAGGIITTQTAPQSTHRDTPKMVQLPDPRLFFDADDYILEPLSPMMQSIASRLQAAKQAVPHYQVSIDVEVSAVSALRGRLNKTLAEKETGEKLTLNDFIIKASALSLIDVPEVNSSFADDAIMRFKNADISVAVALPGGGLITPIVKAAQDKSVRDIAREVKDLAARAGDMRLKPEEYEGGTFSISNLGMFGVAEFNAIINPPQGAILAIGASQTQLKMSDGIVREIEVMRVTLSSDHRVINGAQAAAFLAVFKDYMEQPMELLF